jgi:hypothetical protein
MFEVFSNFKLKVSTGEVRVKNLVTSDWGCGVHIFFR